ncbi:MAG: family 20 glycosylhydrolase [Kiritimatiellae bacterium]|nr:family 20 glycosylhydrolase [Kiritimatiellia bacterium]
MSKVSNFLDLLLPKPQVIERGNGVATAEALSRVEVSRGTVVGAPTSVADEAYELTIRPEGARIVASGMRGERHARTTLAQLAKLSAGSAPCCTIRDWPALKWRGYMNDCGRNFLEVEGVRAIIDMMAAYKMNLFHWHLSDYHGWRLESKKYPQLNRPGTMLRQVGKYYTQDEFREIVAYAAERGVTVMPEFDVPGHTLAFRKGMGMDSMATPGPFPSFRSSARPRIHAK